MEQMKLPKTLIVEDLKSIIDMYAMHFRLDLLKEKAPIIMTGNSKKELEERGIDVAMSFNEAKNYIENNQYRIILLDHNIPFNLGEKAQNIGYSLMQLIKENCIDTLIVGTSSLGREELKGILIPYYKIDKSSYDLGEQLIEMYSKIK
jgi:CheY-like chemotaxis protein